MSEDIKAAADCRHNRVAEDCEGCWRDADNVAEIRDLIAGADSAMAKAVTATYQVHGAIEKLISSRVYDVELAEGSGGDAIAELDQAARSLRNVRRIIDDRKRLLEPEG